MMQLPVIDRDGIAVPDADVRRAYGSDAQARERCGHGLVCCHGILLFAKTAALKMDGRLGSMNRNVRTGETEVRRLASSFFAW